MERVPLLKEVETKALELVRHGDGLVTTQNLADHLGYSFVGAVYVLRKLLRMGLIREGKVKSTWAAKPEPPEQEGATKMLVGREEILNELIATEVRLAKLDDELEHLRLRLQHEREELTAKSGNLKAQILMKVVAPQREPRQHIKKSTKGDLVARAYAAMQQHGSPIGMSDLAILVEMEQAQARGVVAQLLRNRLARRLQDGRYELVVHADPSGDLPLSEASNGVERSEAKRAMQ